MAATRSYRLLGKIRECAAEGLTAVEISTRVDLSTKAVIGLIRHHGIQTGDTWTKRKPPLTPAEAERLKQVNARLHASGPPVGMCRHCFVWHRLVGVRVKPHPLGEEQCPGSHHRPLPRREDL